MGISNVNVRRRVALLASRTILGQRRLTGLKQAQFMCVPLRVVQELVLFAHRFQSGPIEPGLLWIGNRFETQSRTQNGAKRLALGSGPIPVFFVLRAVGRVARPRA